MTESIIVWWKMHDTKAYCFICCKKKHIASSRIMHIQKIHVVMKKYNILIMYNLYHHNTP